MCSIRFSVMLTALVPLALINSCSAILADQPLGNHPLDKLPAFSNFSASSVIMKRYFRVDPSTGGMKDVRSMAYLASAGTFNHFSSGSQFCSGLDMLIAEGRMTPAGTPFMTVELHRAARVFVLLSASLDYKTMSHMTAHGAKVDVQGLPVTWNPAPMFLQFSAPTRKPASTLSNSPLRSGHIYLPRFFVGFAVDLPVGNSLTLTSPATISIHGQTMNAYSVLFAQPTADKIVPFPQPPVPPAFESYLESGVTVVPTRPKPNTYCPDWLHDIYVTPTRADSLVGDEPGYWRTWHPIIDPVYWCYFRHEHGSHPGTTYRPMFGYMAWKTPDNSTTHGRQEESHNGFKIVSFPLGTRVVILTIHIHVSRPRRFSTRHHTVIMAVLSSSGKLQAEVQLKMDFGAALAPLANGHNTPLDRTQEDIRTELRAAGTVGSRRFNVVNIDANYPHSVDRRYRVKALPADPTDLSGLYENWRGIFPTCIEKVSTSAHIGLDVRDPASAMRYGRDYTQMSWLRGYSMKRVLHTRGFTFSRDGCSFPSGTVVGGAFYTNPTMTDLESGPGVNNIRQFIEDGFTPIAFPNAKVLLKDFWSGPHSFDIKGKVSPIRFDGSIKKKLN